MQYECDAASVVWMWDLDKNETSRLMAELMSTNKMLNEQSILETVAQETDWRSHSIGYSRSK